VRTSLDVVDHLVNITNDLATSDCVGSDSVAYDMVTQLREVTLDVLGKACHSLYVIDALAIVLRIRKTSAV
jgi:hypothetical protein